MTDSMEVTLNGQRPPPNSRVGQRHFRDVYDDADLYKKITIARTYLFTKFAFWGHLALTIPFVEDNSKFVPTAGTDGRTIYYNNSFCRRYKTEVLSTVIAHELYHNLAHHVGDHTRRGDRDSKLWNKACDFQLNADLIEMGMEMPEDFPYCYNPKYKGWTVEAIYDDLVAQGEEYSDQFESWDEHLEVELTPGQAQDLSQEWSENMVRADSARRMAEEAGMGSGEMPGNLRRLIQHLHEPKTNWRTMLYRFLVSVISKGYSYMKPSPGPFQKGISIPGFRKRTQSLDLAFAIDTSGSMTVEGLAAIISEILGLFRQMPSLTITMWTFDQQVHEESLVTIRNTDRNALELIRPFLYKMEGGGGTLFEPNWDFMKRKNIRPKVFLMATDGLPHRGWGEPGYCRSIFMIFNDNNAIRAPFGHTIHYKGDAP